MPTTGTHITIIERLALDPNFSPLLGNPNADASDPEGLKARYARLGAIGPDLLYAMMDYSDSMQDFFTFLAEFAGTVQNIGELMANVKSSAVKISDQLTAGGSTQVLKILDDLQSVADSISSVVKEGLLALIIDNGFNPIARLESPRQKDTKRQQWFCADYLHYFRSGKFINQLFVEANGNPNLLAYCYGYLSHYITDIVGHPYVNMVVGSPYRHYWQRHHLVENFIDVYVWGAWHDSHPQSNEPGGGEAPLDTIRTAKQPFQDGAPFKNARLNDLINIGGELASDPVDAFINGVAQSLEDGLEAVGLAEENPVPPGNPDFVNWTAFLSRVFDNTYGEFGKEGAVGPTNMGRNPSPDDIGQAYTLLRIYLKTSTEVGIEEPQFPNMAEDVWNVLKQTLDKLADDLKAFQDFPTPHPGGSFSLAAMCEALKSAVRYLANAVKALIDAALDAIRGVIAVAGTIADDLLKALLWLLEMGLYKLYQLFKAVLARFAYAVPEQEELFGFILGDVSAESLWRVVDDEYGFYPVEEAHNTERLVVDSDYTPWVAPRKLSEVLTRPTAVSELPHVWPGPYKHGDTPDTFIDAPVGSVSTQPNRSLLDPVRGPVDLSDMKKVADPMPYFAGAMAECTNAFHCVKDSMAKGGAGTLPPFPDYNLDGDRGYAWPCWDMSADGQNNGGLDPSTTANYQSNAIIVKNPVTI